MGAFLPYHHGSRFSDDVIAQAEDDGDDEKPIPTGVETFEIAHPDDRSRKGAMVKSDYHDSLAEPLM